MGRQELHFPETLSYSLQRQPPQGKEDEDESSRENSSKAFLSLREESGMDPPSGSSNIKEDLLFRSCARTPPPFKECITKEDTVFVASEDKFCKCLKIQLLHHSFLKFGKMSSFSLFEWQKRNGKKELVFFIDGSKLIQTILKYVTLI